jgi:hypothetical protein
MAREASTRGQKICPANSATDEEKRVKKAIEEAEWHLRPLTTPALSWSIISWNDPDAVRDPKAEFYAAVGFVDALLNPDPKRDKEGRQAADSFLGEYARLVRENIIPALWRGRPPKRQKRDQRPKQQKKGPPDSLRDRWIAAVVEDICRRYGFNPTRNPATKEKESRPSACYIVAEALKRLGIKRLGESHVATIWRRARL